LRARWSQKTLSSLQLACSRNKAGKWSEPFEWASRILINTKINHWHWARTAKAFLGAGHGRDGGAAALVLMVVTEHYDIARFTAQSRRIAYRCVLF
jgi:hypothetical protein